MWHALSADQHAAANAHRELDNFIYWHCCRKNDACLYLRSPRGKRGGRGPGSAAHRLEEEGGRRGGDAPIPAPTLAEFCHCIAPRWVHLISELLDLLLCRRARSVDDREQAGQQRTASVGVKRNPILP